MKKAPPPQGRDAIFPGLPALTAPASDAIAAARQVEYAVLSAAAFDTWLAAAKLRLLPMRQILASPQR